MDSRYTSNLACILCARWWRTKKESTAERTRDQRLGVDAIPPQELPARCCGVRLVRWLVWDWSKYLHANLTANSWCTVSNPDSTSTSNFWASLLTIIYRMHTISASMIVITVVIPQRLISGRWSTDFQTWLNSVWEMPTTAKVELMVSIKKMLKCI